jgi:hypothetical protein
MTMPTWNGDAEQFADYVVRDAGDLQIVVGPLVWKPSDGAASKCWYFTVASAGAAREFRLDCVEVAAKTRDQQRMMVVAAFWRRRPRVVYEIDDELTMARLCERLWPGERITKLRATIERERGAA